MEPSARVHVSTMFSREVTTAEPEIKHTVVAVSFYCCCYNCCPVPGQQSCIEEVEQKMVQMEGNEKKIFCGLI